jgi:hypothetical protein
MRQIKDKQCNITRFQFESNPDMPISKEIQDGVTEDFFSEIISSLNRTTDLIHPK